LFVEEMQRPYHHATRIGNWSEDLELERARLKEYQKKKEKGLLSTQQLASYTDEVELTTSEDGYLHFGNVVMIKNLKTEGMLSTDLGDPVRPTGETFAVTTAKGRPCSRNIFQTVRPRNEPDPYGDDVLRYGQRFQLATTDYLTNAAKLRADKLYLSSTLVTPTIFSKVSHFQEVCTTSESDYGTYWQVFTEEPKFRLESEGSPVQVGVKVVINHCKSNKNLGSDSVPYRNDFGTENEVFCHNRIDQHKAETHENLWAFEDNSVRSVQ